VSSARKMKLNVTPPKPRNPLVAAAATRKAGTHRKPEASQRRAEKMALKKQLKDLRG
jgi:hypothetical protein